MLQTIRQKWTVFLSILSKSANSVWQTTNRFISYKRFLMLITVQSFKKVKPKGDFFSLEKQLWTPQIQITMYINIFLLKKTSFATNSYWKIWSTPRGLRIMVHKMLLITWLFHICPVCWAWVYLHKIKAHKINHEDHQRHVKTLLDTFMTPNSKMAGFFCFTSSSWYGELTPRISLTT